MGRRFVVVLVALVVTTVACGGSDNGSLFGSTTGAPGESSLLDPNVLEFADSVAASLGPEPGLLAVGFAMDRGYEVDQIIPAGLSGGLRADGTIPGEDPSSAPLGFFSDLPDTSGSAAGIPGVWAAPVGLVLAEASEGQMDSGQFLATVGGKVDGQFLDVLEAKEEQTAPTEELTAAKAGIYIIAMLMDLGYTPDQILFGFVGLEGKIKLSPLEGAGVSCWHLEADDGSFVTPGLESSGVFDSQAICRRRIDAAKIDAQEQPAQSEDEPTAAGEPDAGPVDGDTYRAVIEPMILFGPDRVLEGSIEIVVGDGTASGALSWTLRLSRHLDEDVVTCTATTRITAAGAGTVVGDTVTVELFVTSREHFDIEGSDCADIDDTLASDVESDDIPFVVTGTITGDTITGTLYEGLIPFTASR